MERARELAADLVQQRLSAMTLFELGYGVARSQQSDDGRTTVEPVRASKPIPPADISVMRKAGQLSGEFANRGAPVGDGDVVASSAVVVDEPVLPGNVADLERRGVEVETNRTEGGSGWSPWRDRYDGGIIGFRHYSRGHARTGAVFSRCFRINLRVTGSKFTDAGWIPFLLRR